MDGTIYLELICNLIGNLHAYRSCTGFIIEIVFIAVTKFIVLHIGIVEIIPQLFCGFLQPESSYIFK